MSVALDASGASWLVRNVLQDRLLPPRPRGAPPWRNHLKYLNNSTLHPSWPTRLLDCPAISSEGQLFVATTTSALFANPHPSTPSAVTVWWDCHHGNQLLDLAVPAGQSCMLSSVITAPLSPRGADLT